MIEPTVGRMVHFVSVSGWGADRHVACRASIVTDVHGPAVNPATLEDSEMYDVDLCVISPTGTFFKHHSVQMEHARDADTWHWPERV